MAQAVNDNPKDIVKEAVRRFVDVSMNGEKPDLDEFVKQYPGLESQIRWGIQELNKINSLFDSLVRADDSDFENIEDIIDEHDLVGKKVGSFEIVRIIGRGGMGVVYQAKDTRLKRTVAVKSIPAALAGNSTARMRFKREAELLASLNHPNIAVIHGILEEEKSDYLILEHVEGETLTERITRGPLKLEEALSIGKQVAEAISAAHRKGVIHRDLKPANIKITPDGQVKVLDFGLAKATVTEGSDSKVTETQFGRVIGTPAYMSPEQARGKETDHRTDIWSFGCVLYEMLTGMVLFEGETASDTLANILKTEPEWQALPQNTPTEIRTLLHRCIEKDPAQRLETIADAVIDINNTALAPRPTESMEAYEYYLRGNEYRRRSDLKKDFEIGIGMYEKAIELDPTFVQAYTRLSQAHVAMYWLYYDRSDARLSMAKQAVDKALGLDPDLPEAHVALGYYYYHGYLDYGRALEQFSIARKSRPNDSNLLLGIGAVLRRQGKFEEALANFKKASELDPLSVAYEVAETFELLRKYQEAERYIDRVISLAPDNPQLYSGKAMLYVLWEGSTEKARAVLEEAVENLELVSDPSIFHLLVDIDVYDGNYQEALDRLSSKSLDFDNHFYFMPHALRYALVYDFMNEKELAKKYFDEARSILESKVQQRTEDARLHSSLGIAYAGLGQKEDAICSGQMAVKLLPVSKEAYRGVYRVKDLARIYVMVGEFDAAIDQIKYLLSIPGEMSIPLIRLDPAWDPLRDHPRFKKLVESDE